MLQSIRGAMQHCYLAAAGKMDINKPLLAEVFEIPFPEQITALSPVPVYSSLLAPVTVATLGMHQECIPTFTHCLSSLAEPNEAVYPKELQGKLAQC